MTDSHTLIQFNNSKDLGNWYDQKYTEMGGGWKIPQEEAIRLMAWADMTPDKEKTLLDIGCGDGDFLKHIHNYAKCTGIDLSSVGIEFATRMGIDAIFEVNNIENTGYAPRSFDYLTSIGSIEHVIDLDIALKECFRLLKRDGKFLCMVPNELWKYLDQPQEQTHTDQEWKIFFINAGFIIKKVNRRSDLTDFLLTKII